MLVCRLIVAVLAVCAFTGRLSAQQFGGNPPSLKWNQVNTDTVRVVFPAGLDKQALDIAGIVRQLAASTQSTIGNSLQKANIVLQNQTTTANGYAGLGPFRAEFFLTPKQNSFELGSLPWHKTLALHEYRHIQQFNNFRKGVSKAFYLLFGQEGQSVANSAAIPDWFWEGDAVYQETLLSRQGRGRLPYFFNDYRSLWAAGKNYSWMKLRNGSLRDATPDHYRLGYMLTAYGREKFGPEIWKNITGDASRFKGLFYPFQKAVKRNTGENFRSFAQNAMQFFRESSPHSPDRDTPSQYASQHRHFVADEEFPQWMNDSSLIYLRSSYDQPPAFYIRNIVSRSEKKIRVRDISSDHYFSYRNGKIAYAAYQPDLRWGWKDYGIIKVIDALSGKQQTVTKAGKYFSPDISADGKQIVAVHLGPEGKSELHILETASGKLITVLPNNEGLVFTYPKFFDDSHIIAAVRNDKGEMALGSFEIPSAKAQWLTPFSLRVIGFPQVFKDTVYFSMSDTTLDRIYAVSAGKTYRFEPLQDNAFTGNYQLSAGGGRLAWTSYTAVGFYISHSGYRSDQFIPVDLNETYPGIDPYPLSGMQLPTGLLGKDATPSLPVSQYPKSFRLFNFHSWRPYISDPEYSYSLLSQNMLNTVVAEASATYNRNERFKEIGGTIAYGGIFPVISAGGSYTFDRSFRDTSSVVNWNEVNAGIELTLPLNFTSGRFYRNLSLSGGLNTKQATYTGASKLLYENKRFNYGEFSLSASNQLLKARKQIYPGFAQTLLIRYRSIVNNYSGYQFLASGAAYLPGFFNTHSFVVQAAYQFRDTLQQYTFSNGFPFARGYTSLDFPRMWKLGFNYHFPIVYPDWGFANIAYLLRVRANVFYDHSTAESLQTGRRFVFRTAGVEIYFDSKWWNQLPVSFGFRHSRLLDPDPGGRTASQWEFILPVNLLNR